MIKDGIFITWLIDSNVTETDHEKDTKNASRGCSCKTLQIYAVNQLNVV